MTKTLKEIQAENRRLILEANLHGNNLRLLKENIGDFSGAKLTLSQVLLALKKTNITKDYSGQTFEVRLVRGVDENEIDIVHDFLGLRFYNFVRWDLTKETLEEQSEETQRAINKLLTQ